MESDWVVIADYSNEISCQVAMARLQEAGVEALTVDKRDRMYRFGVIELYVRRDKVLVAKQIIKDL